MPSIYTIGYATKNITDFIAQLKRYGITAVADVRSVPFSKIFIDYHQHNIQLHLAEAGIRYVYLGDELGPRSKDEDHYDKGQVNFSKLSKSQLFAKGLQRLSKSYDKGFKVALMCAEKDPANCHRSLLIAYHMQAVGGHDWDIKHINHDGGIEKQEDLEARLVQLHTVKQDMFTDAAQQQSEAYQRQCAAVNYTKPHNAKSPQASQEHHLRPA